VVAVAVVVMAVVVMAVVVVAVVVMAVVVMAAARVRHGRGTQREPGSGRRDQQATTQQFERIQHDFPLLGMAGPRPAGVLFPVFPMGRSGLLMGRASRRLGSSGGEKFFCGPPPAQSGRRPPG
jgi:hypothetical protein